MTEKLCPFDKQPCIGNRCKVYREDLGECSFLFIGRRDKTEMPAKEGRDKSKFTAHLFD
jgi:hypothetical protein